MPGGGPNCDEPRGRRGGGMPLPLDMPFGGIPRGCDIDMRGSGDGITIDVGEPDGGGGPAGAAAIVSAFGLLRLATLTW